MRKDKVAELAGKQMKKHEMIVLVGFLNELSDEFSNAGCNDFELPNTPENRELIIAAEKHADCYEEEWHENDKDTISSSDTIVLEYLIHRLKEEHSITNKDLKRR